MNRVIRWAPMVLVLPALATRPAAQEPETLTVYAAASLTEAFRDLGKGLEQRHPGLKLQFNFAGSQQLATQLEQGAPADVFASADQHWMDYARQKGLVEGESSLFARNRLVVIVPHANPAGIERLEDLTRRGTKVVMAAEAVPAGKYSRRALANLAHAPGFPADYDRRVLANVVSQEENVKNVVAKVQLGEADAGLVYRSDVTPPVSRQVRVFEIPDQFNMIASYPIAVLKSAQNASAGRRFIALLLSNDGQQILRRHGFLPAAAPASVTQP
ncbi:MAG TPA: molybdate ABC transporter substrate-binding protein [Gemmatimonadales bacterium]|nr:molybdate ABC transporter substrate-binding protein [Gemmatimonadales bacterium]